MSEKDIAVNSGTAAPTTGVETNASQGAPTGEKTAEELLKEANAKIEKISQERDNYKRGMLQAKGKQVDNDNDSEDLSPAEIARQTTLQVIAESDLASAVKERDSIIAKVLADNEELRLAHKNRPGTGTGTGSNQSVETPKDNVLSADQERELRARGWDDARIEHFKNLARK